MENLEHLQQLDTLNVSNNTIYKIENISKLQYLCWVYFAFQTSAVSPESGNYCQTASKQNKAQALTVQYLQMSIALQNY